LQPPAAYLEGAIELAPPPLPLLDTGAVTHGHVAEC